MAKYIVSGLDGDEEAPFLTIVPNSTIVAQTLPGIVEPGNPYWVFASLPSAILTADTIGADFTDAPISSEDEEENIAAIDALLANPPATGDGGKVWAAE